MMKPEISVIMPVFNAEQYLRESIESVLGQGFGDFEFLIYDDGSSDSSVEIVKEYVDFDERIRLHCQQHQGHVTWLNSGLNEATAPLIARMDADDICLPDRFLRQMEYMRDHPECVVAGTDFEAIDEYGTPLLIGKHDTDHESLLSSLLSGELGVICHPSAMMRRDAVLRIGGYRTQYEPTEDLDLWFRLAKTGRLGNIPEILLRYRMHDKSICHMQSDQQKALVDEIVTEGRATFDLPPLEWTIWPENLPDAYNRRLMWAEWALSAGNRQSARAHVRVALSIRPPGLKARMVQAKTYLPDWFMSTARRLKYLLQSARAVLRN